MIMSIRNPHSYAAPCAIILVIVQLSGCTTSSLNTAILRNDRERALELAHEGKGKDEKDAAGITPLHNAAKKGDSELVSALLEQGANANVSSKQNIRPLHEATASSYLDVKTVKLLLEYKADPNAQNSAGATPLIFASSCSYDPSKIQSHIEIVDLLLRAGADPNIENNEGKTAIYYAAYRGRPLKVVELLLKNGANAQGSKQNGDMYPLMEAAVGEHVEVFSLLAKAGATPHLTINEDLAERSEKDRLRVNLTFENNARTYSMYGDWLRDNGRHAESYAYYMIAGEQFSMAAKEYSRASKAYKEEITNAKSENTGRVAKSILASVVGIALAATTGHGFVTSPNLTNNAKNYEEEAENYAKKTADCNGSAETMKKLAANIK